MQEPGRSFETDHSEPQARGVTIARQATAPRLSRMKARKRGTPGRAESTAEPQARVWRLAGNHRYRHPHADDSDYSPAGGHDLVDDEAEMVLTTRDSGDAETARRQGGFQEVLSSRSRWAS